MEDLSTGPLLVRQREVYLRHLISKEVMVADTPLYLVLSSLQNVQSFLDPPFEVPNSSHALYRDSINLESGFHFRARGQEVRNWNFYLVDT